MIQTLFHKILTGECPCEKVYENDHVFAFKDIAPKAPVHILIIPKKFIKNISSALQEDKDAISEILLAAREVASLCGVLESGYRLVFNTGQDAAQTVDYLHCHLLGGRKLDWPPG